MALADAAWQGKIPATIELVVCDVPDVSVLQRAAAAGLKGIHLPPGPSRARLDEAAELQLLRLLRDHQITLVCLAGFMRILGPRVLAAYPQAILNIHPSLLPSFPGRDAVRQALEYGVKVTGATVHFCCAEVDAGPVIVQGAVAVESDEDLESLSRKIHAVEHELYPHAASLFCRGQLRMEGRVVRILA